MKKIGTVSCDKSESIIIECKQEDNRICRYNRILEGINRIFSYVLQARTEEELGNACLSVALEVTGSQIGFVDVVGSDGLLHDTAVSDMGWGQCKMYDKTGHRRPPGNFVLHGLYCRVIITGKGFFTNNPQSHPDSIGLPKSHPPITSFLGVPLIEDRKVVGILAVANREGGYICEQMEDLEAITPAVTQALKRKREEKEREQVEQALRVSEERLRRMSSAGSIGLYEWNFGRELIYFSPEAFELYGYGPNSPVTYEKWLTRIHPDDRKMVELNIAKAHENARNMPNSVLH